jgi:hypothetical protein
MPQYGVDGIEQIGPEHTHLVNDQQLEFSEQIALGGMKLYFAGEALRGVDLHVEAVSVKAVQRGQEGPKGKLKQGVQRNAAGINGGYPGGCSHNGLFVGVFNDLTQKGGFACTCLSRKENMTTRMVDKAGGQGSRGGIILHAQFFRRSFSRKGKTNKNQISGKGILPLSGNKKSAADEAALLL